MSYDPRDPVKKERVKRKDTRILLRTSTCFKACFLDEDGDPTFEGERVLADLRNFARESYSGRNSHSFLRDLNGKIDPISMARIEGRREMFRRMCNFLSLDPSEVQHFVEVTENE